MERLSAPERTREELRAWMNGELGTAAGRGDVVRLALRLIVEEALEGEVSDALGRDRYERGEDGKAGYRNGYRPGKEEPARPTRANSGCDDSQGGRVRPFPSCGEDRRRKGDELRQFPQILGGGGQQELVFGPARATQAQSTEPEDALQMSEEHLDLPSFAT